MKIVSVDLFPISLKPTNVDSGPARALPRIPNVETVIIRLNTDSKLVGYGEVTATKPDSNHSASALVDTLEVYAATLVDADALNVNGINLLLDKATGEFPEASRAARSAVDMAIYDLIGKAREVPAYHVLGGAYRTNMEVLATLADGQPEEVAAAATRVAESGVRGLKLNVGNWNLRSGQSAERDMRTILAVLESVQPEVQVDICANQSFAGSEQVEGFIKSLLADRFYGNLALEQPLHRLDLEGHAKLRETLPIPIILSASVVSPQAMMQIAYTAAADRIVIDANRVGGLTPARQIANICESAAIGVSFGGLASTTLGHAAHIQLASTVRDPLPVDVGNSFGFERKPISGGLKILDGRVFLGDGAGLGVELDQELLR